MIRNVWGVLFCCWTIVLTGSCCPKNPQLNTVRTAHGNVDWHIDTAEEFLTGKDMAGTTRASNHCPDTWTKSHMHGGLTNANTFYYDRDVTAAGRDIDATSGIDRSMLFFYAGHGEPTDFDTLGNSAVLTNMRLGNCAGSNDGSLRYYWQCSCEVFAHGPKTCTGTTAAYACPGDFDGSNDSDAMRNVYERWGPILDPALRMACGSSTLAYCWDSETNRVWDNYNNKGYDVADSFIDGLQRYSWNTPLCMTTGGLLAGGTPLFDSVFTNAANPSGPYFHIQYLSSFASTAPTMVVAKVPELIPIFELIPPPLPDPIRKLKFAERGEWLYSMEEVKGRGPAVKVNRNSNAVYLFGERRFKQETGLLDESEYLRLAARLIEEKGFGEKDISKPAAYRMMLQQRPREGKTSELRGSQKNVVITFRRQIPLAGGAVPVLGEGGVIAVQLNTDGTLYNASKVWRTLGVVKRSTGAKPYEQALQEALALIKEKDAYALSDWTWGYEEAAGNEKQTELKAVYQFNFVPQDPGKFRAFPPRIIRVSAHLE